MHKTRFANEFNALTVGASVDRESLAGEDHRGPFSKSMRGKSRRTERARVRSLKVGF